jgi:hypothetical protein
VQAEGAPVQEDLGAVARLRDEQRERVIRQRAERELCETPDRLTVAERLPVAREPGAAPEGRFRRGRQRFARRREQDAVDADDVRVATPPARPRPTKPKSESSSRARRSSNDRFKSAWPTRPS